MITKLKENEIFVFGSNLAGSHGGGAAKYAKDNFGAEEGVGEGFTGKCYAFPTLGTHLEMRKDSELKISVAKLYKACEVNSDKTFLLTAVGTGIAGYPVEYMKHLFDNPPANLTLPDEFK